MGKRKTGHKWLYGWCGDKGGYMMQIRDRKIYARLDALFERMPEDLRRGGFTENGQHPHYGEYFFVREDKAVMCRVYKASFLRKDKDHWLHNLLEHLSEMKELFDIIEEIISESLTSK